MALPRITKLNSRMRFVVAASGGDPKAVTVKEYEETYRKKEVEICSKFPVRDLALLTTEK